jgi:DNA-binding HxlR family transcriptional regulator
MSRRPDARSTAQRPAPVPRQVAWDEAELALALVSGKWVLRVLQVLDGRGSCRHNQLLRELGGKVSARSLDATLRRMEKAGLVNRHVDPGSPPAVSYELTRLATSLIGPLATLGRWGLAHQRELRPRGHLQPQDPAA